MEWNKIVTNALSAVVTMVVVAACTILWREAMSVSDKIEANNQGIQVIIDEVQAEIVEMKEQNNLLVEAINELTEGLVAIPVADDEVEVAYSVVELNVGDTPPPEPEPEDDPWRPGKYAKKALTRILLKPVEIPKDNFLEQRVEENAPRMMEQMAH